MSPVGRLEKDGDETLLATMGIHLQIQKYKRDGLTGKIKHLVQLSAFIAQG
jgi:hypothetical protein